MKNPQKTKQQRKVTNFALGDIDKFWFAEA